MTRTYYPEIHMLRAFLMVILAVPCFAEEVAKPPLPESALKIMAQHDADEAKVDATAVKALEKCLAEEMKKGNLDGANAIKAKIEDLKPKAADPFKIKPSFAGRWMAHNGDGWRGLYIISDDNKVTLPGNTTGKWTLTGDELLLSFDNGCWNKLKVTNDQSTLHGVADNGVQVNLQRTADPTH